MAEAKKTKGSKETAKTKETSKEREEKARALLKGKTSDSKSEEIKELIEQLIKEQSKSAEERSEEREENLREKVESLGVRREDLGTFISKIRNITPIGAEVGGGPANLEAAVRGAPSRRAEDEDADADYKVKRDYGPGSGKNESEVYIPTIKDSQVQYLLHHDGIKRIEEPNKVPTTPILPHYMKKALQKEVYDAAEMREVEESDFTAHGRQSGESKFYVSGTKKKTKIDR